MPRFLNQEDLNAARRVWEIHNSRIKRGEIDDTKIVRTDHVKCGCGAPGCVFISIKGTESDKTDSPG